MPKIVDEARKKILESARKKLLSEGYGAVSLREIARECSIAVGTIYNYFDSKDSLVASIMLDDWFQALSEMDEGIAASDGITDGIIEIHAAVERFSSIYREVWSQFLQSGGSSSEVDSRHLMLRGQIEEKIRSLLARNGRREDAGFAPILAELVLAIGPRTDISGKQLSDFLNRFFQ